MAGLLVSPAPHGWLLLLLLLSGDLVPAMTNSDPPPHPQGRSPLAPHLGTGSACSQIQQAKRFLARKRGSVVSMECYWNNNSGTVTWFREQANGEPQNLTGKQRYDSTIRNSSISILTIQGIQFEDNGIYFCEQTCNDPSQGVRRSCGTELRVMGFSTLEQVKQRNTLKDSIIMIQTLLIILFIVVPIFLLLDKDDSKAGMEEDHTYEGLNIDQTATYEDIVTLRTGEVKWSVGEHPGQE